MNANVASLFIKQASRVPQRPALIFPDGSSISYQELKDEALRIAHGLEHVGVNPGDRLLCMIPMSANLYTTLVGVIAHGATLVFIDPWIKRQQIAQFARYADLKGIIGIPKAHLLRLLDKDLRKLPISISTGCCFMGLPARYSLHKLKQKPAKTNLHEVNLDTPALITFTSGSSGEPKGANRTHHFLTAQHRALKANFPYQDVDIDITNFPVFALNNLAQGLTTVIPDIPFKSLEETDPLKFFNQITKHEVSTCTFSPVLVEKLCEAVKHTGASTALRRILVGGAPVSDDQLSRWVNLLPGVQIEVVYGSTEAEPVAHVRAEDRLNLAPQNMRGILIGKPVEQVHARVVGIQNGSITSADAAPLPTGEIGELIVMGEHVCRSYFRNKNAIKENKIIMTDDRVAHRMGDTGYFDDAGCFYLTGRVHHVIRRNETELLHPMLIETACREVLNISHRLAAIGMGHSENEVWIIIEDIKGVLNINEIQEKMNQSGIIHDQIRLHTEPFPLDPRHRGKIDYNMLRSQIEKLHE